MKVIRAEAMGMCFGVRDALAAAGKIDTPKNVTIHGELVHNERVLIQLQARGFRQTPEAGRASIPETPEVLITAHGISDAERRRLESQGKQLIDTTCPLVRRVHRAALTFQAAGFQVLLIGRPGHVEVQGIVEDVADCRVLASVEDVTSYSEKKLGIVCQTTTTPKLAEQVRAAVRARNPRAEIRYIDTICQPTRDRQQAVERLLRLVDAMVVVGGENSNNTRQLVHLCERNAVPAFHVQSAADIQPEQFTGFHVVGLTAGTSTLDETIQEVYDLLCSLNVALPV